jgi:hypothetical protein
MSSDREFFDAAIRTLEEYTQKVKKMRLDYTIVPKTPERGDVKVRPPAGIKGSANDSTLRSWKKSLRPYC